MHKSFTDMTYAVAVGSGTHHTSHVTCHASLAGYVDGGMVHELSQEQRQQALQVTCDV